MASRRHLDAGATRACARRSRAVVVRRARCAPGAKPRRGRGDPLLAAFGEFEREILRERVRAGLAHARQYGQTLGRPVAAELQADKAQKLCRAGVSKAEIARCLKIGRASVRRILA